MNKLSPRFHFVLLVLVTLFLLVGSTILQQLVFKADQETATLALTPTTFRSTEGGVVDFDITSASADTVFATGLQAEIELDATKFELVEALPRVGWRTLVLHQGSGLLTWLSAPESTSAIITEVSDGMSLGRIRLKTLTAGAANLSLNQRGTILAAVDPVEGNFVYNAAVGVQSSVGTITALSENNLDFPETVLTTLTAPESNAEPLFGAQRITSTYAAATARDVLVFVTLAYPGQASIEFGTSPEFGNIVESVNENTNHVLRIASLEPGQQYYYRVVGDETGEQSRVVGVTRSIAVPVASTGGVVSASESEVIAFPTKTIRNASLYVFPRDAKGAALTDVAISLATPEDVVSSSAKKQAGYWQFDITGTASRKEVIALRPSVEGDISLSSASIVIDPNYAPARRVGSVQELVLEWNQRTMIFLLGAAVLLFLLGLLFTRLVRSR